jgi:hypothetical protein
MRVAGDEFCSREHQSQFRMRQGMDRLREANKVASLMRRRENPKPISAMLPSASSGSQRVFPPAPPASGFTSQVLLERRRSSLPGPNISSCPTSEWTRMRLSLAGAVLIQGAAGAVPATTSAAARTLTQARQPASRISVATQGFRSRAAHTSGFERSSGPGMRPIVRQPSQGRLLRVSASSGFRVAEPRKRACKIEPERTAGVDALRGAPGHALPSQHCSGGSPSARSETVGMPPPLLWSPPAPSGWRQASLREPAAARVKLFIRNTQAQTSRSGFMQCDTEECVLPSPEISHDLAPFPEPRHPRAAAAPALVPAGAPRFGKSPFTPRDTLIRPSRVTIQGVATGAPVIQPKPRPAVELTTLEDHFAKGWGDWMGQTDDWKVDIAGVRTGSLLLYGPSMELTDYQLEFLARIEKHSVSWVFRASGFERYYLASIAASPDGTCQFTQRTVVDGIQGPITTAPVRRAKSASHAFTVRTSVNGGEFAVYVDGVSVAQWTDNRLAAGGIGFLGTPENRARLYWVKISFGESARSQS